MQTGKDWQLSPGLSCMKCIDLKKASIFFAHRRASA